MQRLHAVATKPMPRRMQLKGDGGASATRKRRSHRRLLAGSARGISSACCVMMAAEQRAVLQIRELSLRIMGLRAARGNATALKGGGNATDTRRGDHDRVLVDATRQRLRRFGYSRVGPPPVGSLPHVSTDSLRLGAQARSAYGRHARVQRR